MLLSLWSIGRLQPPNPLWIPKVYREYRILSYIVKILENLLY